MRKLTFMTMLAFCIALVGFSIEACAEDLEISGFFDVTTSYNHNADDKTDFAMNQAEVDLEKQLSDIASASVAIAYNSEEGIFELAVEKLGVMPEKCIYVADGMRQELATASKLGMLTLQIRVPTEIDDSPLRESWDGPTISSLWEITTLLNK